MCFDFSVGTGSIAGIGSLGGESGGVAGGVVGELELEPHPEDHGQRGIAVPNE